MRYRLPSLNGLRAFEAAARRGSLSAAARELNVTVAAISRHVTLLEAHFGIALVERRPDGVVPTDAGRAFFAPIARAFEEIDGASRALKEGRKSTTLHAALYTTFATEWLAPRLAEFRLSQPGIDLRLTVTTEEIDLDRRDVDVALTAMPRRDSTLRRDFLFNTHVTPVCAPSMRERFVSPRVIGPHDLLYARRELPLWRDWTMKAGLPELDMTRFGVEFENLSLTYQMARGGAGLALGQLFYVADDLVSGRLVMPFPIILDYALPHCLVYRETRADEPAITAFRDWLIDQAATTNEMVATLLR